MIISRLPGGLRLLKDMVCFDHFLKVFDSETSPTYHICMYVCITVTVTVTGYLF